MREYVKPELTIRLFDVERMMGGISDFFKPSNTGGDDGGDEGWE